MIKKSINTISSIISSYAGVVYFPNLNIVYCEDERTCFYKFIKMIEYFKPDIITGFNDHSYDWVYINNKIDILHTDLKHDFYKAFNNTDIVNNYAENSYFTKSEVKISAEIRSSVCYPNSNYVIFIDTRTEFRKIYPKDIKSSLNYYLEKLKMDLKEDMPYKKLFEIYEKKR